MNELLNEVTPETRAIIWRTSAPAAGEEVYKEMDYLLDGLLTASFTNGPITDHMLVGNSFGRKLYVYITSQTLKDAAAKSFIELLKRDLLDHESILVIDAMGGGELEKYLLSLGRKIHTYQPRT